MKNLLLTLSLALIAHDAFSQASSKKVNIAALIGSEIVLPAEGGSGVGGGGLYDSLMDWCTDTSHTIEEALEEADEARNLYSDKPGTLRAYYKGLENALKSVPTEGENFANLVSFKAISRGIELANTLGIKSIIDGDFRRYSNKDLQELVSVMSFYYEFLKEKIHTVDQKYYIPYLFQKCQNCKGIPKVDTLTLEREYINYSKSQVTNWRKRFINVQKNGEGHYTKLDLDHGLRGLKFFINELAKDLKLNLFENVYECQIKKLDSLATKIEKYTSERKINNSLDAIKLNQFTNKLDEYMRMIDQKSCH